MIPIDSATTNSSIAVRLIVISLRLANKTIFREKEKKGLVFRCEWNRLMGALRLCLLGKQLCDIRARNCLSEVEVREDRIAQIKRESRPPQRPEPQFFILTREVKHPILRIIKRFQEIDSRV
jgi:hypothetical protein